MEGEKERERERGEEKESDETEEEREKESDEEEEEREKESDEEEEDAEGAAMVWQEGYGEDDLGLPIMHWEALSLRIAELEKQEEERKEKSSSGLERGRVPTAWREARERGRSRETGEEGEEGEEDRTSRVTALTSRLQTQTNLQLCFINNSESEEEEEEENSRKMVTGKKGAVPAPQAPPTGNSSKSSGFKFEVRAALGALRDKLRTEQKKEVSSDPLLEKRRQLNRSDLMTFSTQQLRGLHSSLSQAIQDLSSELVARLQTRDQLRTEQDAMLLEVQDMTSL